RSLSADAGIRVRRVAARAGGQLRTVASRGRPRAVASVTLSALLAAAVAFATVSLLTNSGGGRGSTTAKTAPGWLGVQTISTPVGATFASVAPGSPAEAAGLTPGDVITQIDNRQVTTSAGVESVLASLRPGERVEIHIQQGPFGYTRWATLATRPAGGP